MTGSSAVKIEKNVIIIFGVTLIAVMGIASITPAFPGIIHYFGISTQQVGWLIAAFTLPGVFLTPVTVPVFWPIVLAVKWFWFHPYLFLE